MNTKHITKEHSVCAIMHGISREIGCFPTKSVECFVPLFSNILGKILAEFTYFMPATLQICHLLKPLYVY